MGKIFIEKDYFLRDEINGLTVYERGPHLYTFYEGLSTTDIAKCVTPLTTAGFRQFIEGKRDLITQNIESELPFYAGWEVTGACNLDCIYCFADNLIHTKDTADIIDTARHILKVDPMVIGLSGGEPTLNPRLPEIMRLFYGRIAMILNTNGTTESLASLVPLLKETGTLVRLTIDTLDNKLLNQLRPPKNGVPDYDQAGMLKKNTSLLIEAGVPFMIHTVITKKNINTLEKTAEELIRLGVKRWHFYAVDYSNKCADFYDEIKVTAEEVGIYCEQLKTRFGDKLHITYPKGHILDRRNAILLIDSTGRFAVNQNTETPTFIGADPKHPTQTEIMSQLAYETHRKCYLTNFWE